MQMCPCEHTPTCTYHKRGFPRESTGHLLHIHVWWAPATRNPSHIHRWQLFQGPEIHRKKSLTSALGLQENCNQPNLQQEIKVNKESKIKQIFEESSDIILHIYEEAVKDFV